MRAGSISDFPITSELTREWPSSHSWTLSGSGVPPQSFGEVLNPRAEEGGEEGHGRSEFSSQMMGD